MPGMQVIRGRIGAARVVSEAAAGTPQHGALSKSQAGAVLDTGRRNQGDLSSEDRASLVQLAASVDWHVDDTIKVLDALSGSQSDAKNRRGGQDFTTIPHYLDEQRWGIFGDKDVSLSCKEEVLMELAKALGCRCPSEPSLKLWDRFYGWLRRRGTSS